MSDETRELLMDVRRAFRLVHGYQRRLLDALRPAVEAVQEVHPDLRHLETKPFPYAKPMSRHDPTAGKWAWDYLPLAHCDMTWATSKRPSDGAVYFGVRHVVDTGFKEERGREPDSAHFDPAAECATLIEPVILRVVGEPAHKEWDGLYGASEEGSKYEGWAEPKVHEVVVGGCRVRFGGLRVDVADLESADTVRERLVQPVALLAQQLAGPR